MAAPTVPAVGVSVFFFQAEDGIRDDLVTGVQTCALPISSTGFIAAPCTGPVLAALLAYVANTQSTVLGGSLLFLYALGIGVPFYLIGVFALRLPKRDRKSTRLNSSHQIISYAVFCLKKKK